MNLIKAFLPKIMALFFKFWKRAGETSPFPPYSYAPAYIFYKAFGMLFNNLQDIKLKFMIFDLKFSQ